MKPLAIAIIAAATALPTLAAADQWESQVREYFTYAETVLNDGGYRAGTDIFMDRLRQNESDRLTVTIGSPGNFLLLGLCDADCPDLDLKIYDSRGALVGQDTEVDSTPIVEFYAPTRGDYTLEVLMYRCTTEPCRYGVRLYER